MASGRLPNSPERQLFSERRTIPEPWVSVDKVASHLGVAKDSVYRWIEAKSLPAHRVGRLWKFRLSEIDDWVQARGANNEDEQREPK